MTDEQVESIIRGYLPNVIHMSLSTSRGNKPWTCEVHYSYDKGLNLYFFSKPSRRHSEDIALNPFVSGNIVRQHEKGEAPRGVYFEGTAELLKDVDQENPAYFTYDQRFQSGKFLLEEMARPDGHQFYKITVSDWYVFDAVESKPSQKYHLKWGGRG